jgi:hypothetical protein
VLRVRLQSNGVDVNVLTPGDADAHRFRLWSCPMDG